MVTFKRLRELKPVPVNPGEKRFYPHSYLIHVGCYGSCFLVHEYSEQDAINTLVDFLDDGKHGGYFAEHSEPGLLEAYYDESHPEHAYMQDFYFPAGNASKLFTSEISLETLR